MGISEKLSHVNKLIRQALEKRKQVDNNYEFPRLIALSKLKPIEFVIDAYDAGQRDFAKIKNFWENYIQELIDKSNNPTLLERCRDVRWHFIGHLQSNKSKKLNSIPNLASIQTVESIKLAELINRDWNRDEKLNYFIQVNTSGEENKSGINPEQLIDFLRQIQEKGPKLEFKGLMTIGALATSLKRDENEDFDKLVSCRDEISSKLNINANQIALSMGMSNDFEQAILKGSNFIRIGTSIFGERDRKWNQSIKSSLS